MAEKKIVKPRWRKLPHGIEHEDERPDSMPGEYGEPDESDGGLEDGPGYIAPIKSAPTNLRIKEQRVSYGPDGTAVIDAVLEFDDVPWGAAAYEVRWTPVGG